ncbi:putative multidrug ABC transporter permease YbhR [Paenibacillus plantiphilus]|uniref:Multidrug ABC transporter permease YbhR n=1 Tax=Paenibacillus plantiphilus TaxID=2905650 RepID=A0ABM9BM71_9BACL|nr:ABC transporter permease [Paenibacillus plantiphilus]CAH1190152.1 putative multidrug ABC transporter permease YbhR [Paenibacillus plantiphilus]
MKSYTQLTIAQLRLFARNKQVLFWTLAFPVFLMIMLGSFAGGSGSGAINGYYYDEDGGSEGSRTVIAALERQNDVLRLEPAAIKEAAMQELREGEKGALIIIPKGFGASMSPESIAAGTQAKLQLYYDQTQAVRAQTAINALEQVTDGLSKSLVHYAPVVVLDAVGVQSLELEYIDFLVPGIVAMMIMSNNLNGVAGQIASWRERGVLRRMQSTPLRPSSFIAAQITARLLLNGSQAVIVLLISSLLFGTQVNGSWPLLLVFVILGTLAFMAIGFIIAGLAKTPESAGPIAGFIAFPMMFLGGVFFPISNMPSYLQPIVNALPIAHLSTSLRQIMNVGAGLTQLWGEALLLGGWLVLAFIIASFTFKWQ